ncbi:MAG: hypothetical protein ACI4IV_04320 [Acutalibacteraceae bacterium]
MKHKRILFDDIYSESDNYKALRLSRRKNRLSAAFFGIFRIVIVILLSVVGSVLLSAVLTAIFNNKSVADVLAEWIARVKAYF